VALEEALTCIPSRVASSQMSRRAQLAASAEAAPRCIASRNAHIVGDSQRDLSERHHYLSGGARRGTSASPHSPRASAGVAALDPCRGTREGAPARRVGRATTSFVVHAADEGAAPDHQPGACPFDSNKGMGV
jgi:hypothetical protein